MTCKILEKLQELCQECEHNQPVKETTWQKDPKTGLKWGPIAEKPMAWQEAMDWAKEQRGRLPERGELIQLFDSNLKNIIISMYPKIFWSSSFLVGYTDYAWDVNFNYGYVRYDNKTIDFYARCVWP